MGPNHVIQTLIMALCSCATTTSSGFDDMQGGLRNLRHCAWKNWLGRTVCSDVNNTDVAKAPKSSSSSNLQPHFFRPGFSDSQINDSASKCYIVRDGELSVNGCESFRKRSCPRKICQTEAFDSLEAFTARTAFVGAVVCAANTTSIEAVRDSNVGLPGECSCFYPGLSRCQAPIKQTAHLYGDSTMRQVNLLSHVGVCVRMCAHISHYGYRVR